MSRPVRLLHLCEFAPREPGSFIFMVVSILAAARRLGWEASAVFLENSRGSMWEQNFRDEGVGLEFAPEVGNAGLTEWLSERVADDAPTVLHTHFHNFDVPSVRVARKRPQTAVVWHIHSTMPTAPYRHARNAIKFATYGRGVDSYLCPAPNIADDVRARFAPKNRVHFMPSAIEIDRFPLAGPAERDRARSELEIDGDASVLVHFGWHWHLKGGDIFLDTVERLLADGVENLVALERGGGETARKEIAQRGLQGVVREIPTLPSIAPLFEASDMLVSSSRSEGMAYTVLESLCMGTPVIATQIPGHQFIGAAVDACRIVVAEPGELAGAVKASLAREPEVAERERLEARRWIEENLSLEVVADRIIDVYRQALAKPVNT